MDRCHGNIDWHGRSALSARTNEANNDKRRGRFLRASMVLVCPFHDAGERDNAILRELVVFHMDECLDWQARELPLITPDSFRGFMRSTQLSYDPAILLPRNRRLVRPPTRWGRCR